MIETVIENVVVIWLRITDEGSVPQMRILFILLIKSQFKMV